MKNFTAKKGWVASLLIVEMVLFNLPLTSFFALAEGSVPVAVDDTKTTLEDTSIDITLGATDSDLPPQTLTFSTTSNPTHGTLGTISGNQVIYTPAPDYNGSDSFTFKANDGTVNSNTATVDITVTPVNDAPTIALNGDNPMSLMMGSTFTDPGATGSDVEDGALTASATGTVDTDTIGSYVLTYTVTDSGELSASTTRTVNVTDIPPVDVCPNIEGVQETVPEGKQLVDGQCVDILGGNASVELATDTPSSSTFVSGQALADLAHFTFTNPTVTPIKVSGLTFKRLGVSNDFTLASTYLFKAYNDGKSDGGERITNSAVMSGDIITFSNSGGLFTIPAGGEVIIFVQSDLITGASGQTVGVSLENIISDADISGEFPIAGNIHTIATVTMATVTFSPPVTPGVGSVDMQAGVTLWQSPLTVTTKPAKLKTVAFKIIGDVSSSDLGNFRLFLDDTPFGRIISSSDENGFVKIDLGFPVSLLLGTHVLKLSGDINGTAGKTFAISVESSADVVFLDDDFNQPIMPMVGWGSSFSPMATGVQTISNTVISDTDAAPVVTLLGDNPIIITLGDTFNDPGATAEDTEDGDITASIIKTGAVDTHVTGSYLIRYTVHDTRMKWSEEKTRFVIVDSPSFSDGAYVWRSNDTPASGTLVSGQALADLAHFTFTNPTSAPISVTNLVLKRIGVSIDAALTSVYLFNGTTRLTNGAFVSSGKVVYNNPSGIFIVPANGSVTIAVKSDILTGTSGETISVSLESAFIDSVAIAGTFPINGNLHTIATVTMAGVDWGGVVAPATANIETQNDYVMWQDNFTVSTHAVDLNSVSFRVQGTVASSDIVNFRLYRENVVGATTTAPFIQMGQATPSMDTNGYVTFTFPTPIRFEMSSHTIKLVGDIVGGATKDFRFSVESSADVIFLDSELGVAVLPMVQFASFTPLTAGVQTISGNVPPLMQPQCSDGIDNDGDGNIDTADSTCHTNGDSTDASSYNPYLDTENSAPVITILGDNPTTLAVGDTFTDSGATAHDVENGDIPITSTDITSMRPDGTRDTSVDTSKSATYMLTYTTNDSQGYVVRANRAVNVISDAHLSVYPLPPGNVFTGGKTADIEVKVEYPGAQVSGNIGIRIPKSMVASISDITSNEFSISDAGTDYWLVREQTALYSNSSTLWGRFQITLLNPGPYVSYGFPIKVVAGINTITNDVLQSKNLEANLDVSVKGVSTLLKAPTITLVQDLGGSSIKVNWVDNSPDVTNGFVVTRSVDGGAYAYLTDLNTTFSSFTDTNAVPGKQNCYVVRSITISGGQQASSAPVCVTASAVLQPVTLTSVTAENNGDITVNWSDGAGSIADGYGVMRRINSEPYTQVAQLPQGTFSYRDSNTSSEQTHCYFIRSYTNSGGQADSTGACATAVSTKFLSGDRIKVVSMGVAVNEIPNGISLGTAYVDSIGTIIGGPVYSVGYWWWKVDYDTGADGWSQENFLEKTSSSGGGGTVNQPPVITIIGANPLHLAFGSSFYPNEYALKSDPDGDSVTMTWNNPVNTAVADTYQVVYTATDIHGAQSSQTLTVIVDPALETVAKFSTNDRIIVFDGPVNVRNLAGLVDTNVLGTQVTGNLGTVIGGPVAKDGYTWWNINYDTGADGWSAEDFLGKYTTEMPPPPSSELSISADDLHVGVYTTYTLKVEQFPVTLTYDPSKANAAITFSDADGSFNMNHPYIPLQNELGGQVNNLVKICSSAPSELHMIDGTGAGGFDLAMCPGDTITAGDTVTLAVGNVGNPTIPGIYPISLGLVSQQLVSNVTIVATTPTNSAPILDPIGNKTTDEFATLGFIATATDADNGDILTYSLSGTVPDGATINPTTGLFTWTPTESQVGSHTFDVEVTDGTDIDSETITVEVTQNNSSILSFDGLSSDFSDGVFPKKGYADETPRTFQVIYKSDEPASFVRTVIGGNYHTIYHTEALQRVDNGIYRPYILSSEFISFSLENHLTQSIAQTSIPDYGNSVVGKGSDNRPNPLDVISGLKATDKMDAEFKKNSEFDVTVDFVMPMTQDNENFDISLVAKNAVGQEVLTKRLTWLDNASCALVGANRICPVKLQVGASGIKTVEITFNKTPSEGIYIGSITTEPLILDMVTLDTNCAVSGCKYITRKALPLGDFDYHFDASNDVENMIVTKQPEVNGVMQKVYSGYDNVMFIPGIMGSQLSMADYVVWPPGTGVGDLQWLTLNTEGNSERFIQPTDIISEAHYPLGNSKAVYRDFIKYMNELVDGGLIKKWEAAPYDWRLSFNSILNNPATFRERLERLQETSRTGRAIVVAHSMGGLISKKLLKQLEASTEMNDKTVLEHISNLVLVASPQIGTPEAERNIMHGEPADWIKDTFIYSPKDFMNVAHNSRSAYSLIPSDTYINKVNDWYDPEHHTVSDGTALVRFDSSLSNNVPLSARKMWALWPERYNGKITDPIKFSDFLKAEGDDFRTSDPMSVTDTNVPLKMNTGALSDAVITHAEIDYKNSSDNIKVFQVVGTGVAETPQALKYFAETQTKYFDSNFQNEMQQFCSVNICLSETPVRDGIIIYGYIVTFSVLKKADIMTNNGDGTVVAPSAAFMNVPTAYVDLGKYASSMHLSYEHSTILSAKPVQDQIWSVLTKRALGSVTDYVSYKPPALGKMYLSAFSPVTIGAYDEFNRFTGLKVGEDGTEQSFEDIPGSSYFTSGDGKYLALDPTLKYRIVMQGTGEGNFTLFGETVENGEVTNEIAYHNVPVTPEASAEMMIENTLEEVTSLTVDVNSDGTPDYSLPALESFSDVTSPTTEAILSGTMGNNNWRITPVLISLLATDNDQGSGVQKTFYSLDDGEWQLYSSTSPIVVSADGEHTLKYYSIDWFGNTEETKNETFKIDQSAPEVSVVAPANGAEYLLHQNVSADWSASDAASGLLSVAGTTASGALIDTSTAGEKTYAVTATDNAGNVAVKTVTYYVRYLYGGILQPINGNGTSIFKFGSTVPVKFQLKDTNGNFITSAIAKIYLSKLSDGVYGTEFEADSTSAASTGNQFRYDTDANQYIFNLSTKPLSVGTWQIRIALDDGSSKTVNISLK